MTSEDIKHQLIITDRYNVELIKPVGILVTLASPPKWTRLGRFPATTGFETKQKVEFTEADVTQ